jgi:hypothetical protein
MWGIPAGTIVAIAATTRPPTTLWLALAGLAAASLALGLAIRSTQADQRASTNPARR